ncbi:hypothetical protein [Chitinilyticum piscinae]|uniref:Uncharacterized protein n=1 Tax=Chitinilyticum piscinae TaxID=2866724 RepID=A0A8J7FKV8_9NEIS|nr:hypothetical protein [Chitinilyticum piscinae]MBE9608026.1 hypothetical protein [Chitinilyticum piscinae]
MELTYRFSKTQLGLDEVQERVLGLGLKQRQVLIMVDGKKTVADLQRFVPEPELSQRLQELLGQHLIELLHDVAPAPPRPAPAPAPAATHSSPATAPLQVNGLPSARNLAQIRMILAMCSQQYLNDALDTMLIDLFDNLSGPDDLNFCIDAWHKRMLAAGFDGIAESHMSQIRAALR